MTEKTGKIDSDNYAQSVSHLLKTRPKNNSKAPTDAEPVRETQKRTSVSLFVDDVSLADDIGHDLRLRKYRLSASAIFRLAIRKLKVDDITDEDIQGILKKDLRRADS